MKFRPDSERLFCALSISDTDNVKLKLSRWL